ncbi:mitochondrial chaperone BCS1 [Octopus bimaculoides]|uniref:Mitochondrial chaperone BCS1 n=1 Tax=Octopus bimaculoides TaxID=37653 RepID=A0A0L8HFF2_OCTBM|nr:mitochondrial chaperone BCS1 [Octopus bimaculoides]|eukprot:XP_014772747.1 PREDICTED: mitochondrial chaperone BCS1-like [Octopus bimaculoides]
MTVVDLLGSLTTNPYFGAGFGLVGVGTGMAALRKLSQYGVILLRRNYLISLEVPSSDKSYRWLLHWISNRAYKRTQHLSVHTKYHQSDTGRVFTYFDFVPSPGDHFFKHKGNWFKVERNREKTMGDFTTGTPFETVSLTAVGQNKQLFIDILNEAREIALKEQEGRTVMYTPMGAEWRQLGYPKRKRPLHSVILDHGISEGILEDINEFISSVKWYTDRGIPYRRGYLLYGPPGCGKSSYIVALAGKLDYHICVMNLSERSLTDDRVAHLLTTAPEQSIILLEDIDAAFVSRDLSVENPAAYQGFGRLTLSGLLNALDGVASAEGRIVFMTTNYLNRLDSALIRPGRVDIKEKIDFASKHQIKTMFLRFYPEELESMAEQFADQLLAESQEISAAQLQGYFLMHKSDSKSALDNVQQLPNF